MKTKLILCFIALCGIANAQNNYTVLNTCNLVVTGTLSNAITCYGASNGLAKASGVSGGVAPYTYSWSNGSTIYIASNLSAGTYSVTITDKNGCTATASVTLSQPAQLRDSVASITYPSCNGTKGSITMGVTGGTSPYTYTWTPNVSTTNTATGLVARSYTVMVKDKNGCMSEAYMLMTQPAGIIDVTTHSILDTGNCSGSAWVTVNSGVPPYTYLWTGGDTTDTIKNQCAGYYCCTISDSAGCIDSVCATIPSSTTGIDKLTMDNGELIVYPNPNGGIFTLSCHSERSEESLPIIEIYNVLGEKVLTETPVRTGTGGLRSAQGDNLINLSDKPDGVYFYRVLTNNGNLVGEGKIIVEK